MISKKEEREMQGWGKNWPAGLSCDDSTPEGSKLSCYCPPAGPHSIGCLSNRMSKYLQAIIAERHQQDQKWGRIESRLGKTDENWIAILGEELGECCQDVDLGDSGNLKKELIQVAAVCVAFLEAMEEREKLGVMLIPNDGLAELYDLPVRMGVLFGTICRERLKKGSDDRPNEFIDGIPATGVVSDPPVTER